MDCSDDHTLAADKNENHNEQHAEHIHKEHDQHHEEKHDEHHSEHIHEEHDQHHENKFEHGHDHVHGHGHNNGGHDEKHRTAGSTLDGKPHKS